MKVLHLSQYVYFPAINTFEKNNSGLGYMVADITRSLAKKNIEVWLLTHSGRTNYKQIDNINFVRKQRADILISLTLGSIIKGIKVGFNTQSTFKKSLKIIGYYAVANYARKCIEKLKPDIVHIHGLGFAGMAFIEMCDKYKIKYLITLHGLIGLDEKVIATNYEKKYEKLLLLHCEKMSIPVTVISTGVKNRIVNNYLLKPSTNITVIPNGTEILASQDEEISVRKKYNIPIDAKILLSIGNVSENKNQKQLINAYFRLPQDLQLKTYILILGNDSNSIISKEKNKYEISDNIISCGFIPRTKLGSYFREADLNVFLSLNDGFGLSMIEAMAFGVPTVTFGDLDAIPDIYDNKIFYLCENRSDEAVAKVISEALSITWDKRYIRDKYSKFNFNSMSDNYIDVYKSLLSER